MSFFALYVPPLISIRHRSKQQFWPQHSPGDSTTVLRRPGTVEAKLGVLRRTPWTENNVTAFEIAALHIIHNTTLRMSRNKVDMRMPKRTRHLKRAVG